MKRKSYILTFLFAIVSVIIFAFLVSIINIEQIKSVFGDKLGYVSGTEEILSAEEKVSEDLGVHITHNEFCNGSDIRIVKEISVGDDMWRPLTENGEVMYCIKPGAPLSTSARGGRAHLSKEEIYAFDGQELHEDCGCAPDVEGYLDISDPYAICEGRHYWADSSYGGGKLYDVAFIVSFQEDPHIGNYGDWADAIQQAIWMSPICLTGDPGRGHDRAAGLAISKMAENYKDFFTKIMEQKSDGHSMVKADTTDYSKVQIDVEYTDDDNKEPDTYYRMGPFKIDYVSGVYESNGSQYSFGGISNMYLYYDDGKTNPEHRIEITHFLYPDGDVTASGEGRYVKPRYFNVRWPAGGADPGYPETGEVNKNLVDFYHGAYGKVAGYPEPNQEFYIEFRASDLEGIEAKSLKLHVDFKFLTCEMEICIRNTVERYQVQQDHVDTTHYHPTSDGGRRKCHDCDKTSWIDKIPQQACVYIAYADRHLDKDELDIPFEDIPIEDWPTLTMKIGGFVFEDYKTGKEQDSNNNKGDEDIVLKNIEVTLWEVDESGNKKLAELATYEQEFPGSTAEPEDDYTRRINPTLTDEKGYYEFRGVDKSKKYVVEFSYNGQDYMPTNYITDLNGTQYTNVKSMVDNDAEDDYYNSVKDTEPWKSTSKATEITSEREAYDKKFASIGSYPKNYATSNSLGYTDVMLEDGGIYNKTFTKNDLLGLELDTSGQYVQRYTYYGAESLIDYIKIEGENSNSKQVTFVEGAISKRIREFIDAERRYPTDEEMISVIYASIIGSTDDENIKNKLQFIEDCKISAWTKNQQASENILDYDLYPVYDRFKTYVKSGNKYPINSYANGSYDGTVSEYASVELPKAQQTGGTETELYKNVYPGQLQINLGLWERQEADMSIKKDAYKVALKINGKMQVYDYDDRNVGSDENVANQYDALGNRIENTTWDISVRLSDGYYGTISRKYYELPLYPDDYNYMAEFYGTDWEKVEAAKLANTGEKTSELEIYITYKIAVRNQSMSIITEIDELADHYDEDMTYMPGLSWSMCGALGSGLSELKVTDTEYYEAMKNYANKEGEDSTGQFLQVNDRAQPATDDNWQNSQYGSHPDVTKVSGYQAKGYDQENAIYIRSLDGKKLASGQTAMVYLTFKVDKEDRIILDDSDEQEAGKKNIVEINGYSTYYKDGTVLPNYGTKGQNDVAGLLDVDSNPGNLDPEKLPNNGEAFTAEHERFFEDDADHAPDVRIILNDEYKRTLSGRVIEDDRTKTEATAIIGDGNLDENKGIEGVTVQLVELITQAGTDEKLEQIMYEGTGNAGKFIQSTDGDGNYTFENFIPGDYIVRFRYGDTTKTALAGVQGGANNTAYNGQDYKSTIYQGGQEYGPRNGNKGYDANQTGQYVYDFIQGDANTGWSDAKDMMYNNDGITEKDADDSSAVWAANRTDVNNYSDDEVKNHIAEVLASAYQTPQYKPEGSDTFTQYSNDEMNYLHSELIRNTQMRAETGTMNVEIEYNRNNSYSENTDKNGSGNNWGFAHDTTQNTGNTDFDWVGGSTGDWNGDNETSGNIDGNYSNGEYDITNVNLGLTERPKAQLALEKQVENVQITLLNGDVIFDATQKADNMMWVAKDLLADDPYEHKTGDSRYHEKYYDELYYESDNRKLADYRTADKGVIQAFMDEELMQGATIKLTYKISVRNIGETDYLENSFYYAGIGGNTVATTSLDTLLDYVNNNLSFHTDAEYQGNTNQGSYGWSVVNTRTSNTEGVPGLINNDTVTNGALDNFINANLDYKADEFITKVWTESLAGDLQPESYTQGRVDGTTEKTIRLILSNQMSPNSATDDLTYTNIAEIVKTSNTAGRRMSYSVVGNQNPSDEPAELDSARAEEVKVLPPYGETHIYYVLIGAVLVIIALGIIGIRKWVLGKKK